MTTNSPERDPHAPAPDAGAESAKPHIAAEVGDDLNQRVSRWHTPAIQSLVILLVSALLFLPFLGRSGFSMSEGHRVAPAWEMLERGDWLVPHMFERVYLRKPPAMPWAIAASSMAFGKTEFAARLVSALATGLAGVAACWFAGRWFGRKWGLSAGLGLVLMPVVWSPAISAEIESLHNMFVLVASLAILDLGLGRNASQRGSAMVTILGGVALGGALLAKGPAGVPVLLGSAAALLLTRALPVKRLVPALLVMAAIALAMFVPVVLQMKRAASLPDAVTQGVDEFLWSRKKLGEIAILPVMGLLSAFPASLAMLFPWGRDAKGEPVSADDTHALRAARACSLAMLAALGIYTLSGVSNPRYVMPALGLAALVVPYVFRGAAGTFTPLRRKILRWCISSRPMITASLLVFVGIGAGGWVTASRVGHSGAACGREMAELIRQTSGPDCQVVADHAIEARPEVLLEIQRQLSAAGSTVRARWAPLDAAHMPPVGGYLLLREDAESGEAGRLREQGLLKGFRKLGQWNVAKFTMGLYLREHRTAGL